MQDKNIIQVRNLSKNFGHLEVLKDISIDFKEKEVVSIIGPSGGGKSTFLRCLNLLEKDSLRQEQSDLLEKFKNERDLDTRRQIASRLGEIAKEIKNGDK